MYSTITLSLILYHVQTCNSLLTKKVTTHKGFNQKKRTCKLGHNGPIVSFAIGAEWSYCVLCHWGTIVLLCPIAIAAQWSFCVPLPLGHNGPTVSHCHWGTMVLLCFILVVPHSHWDWATMVLLCSISITSHSQCDITHVKRL